MVVVRPAVLFASHRSGHGVDGSVLAHDVPAETLLEREAAALLCGGRLCRLLPAPRVLHDEVPRGRGVARVVQGAAAGVVAGGGVRAALQQRARRGGRVAECRVVQRRPTYTDRAATDTPAKLQQLLQKCFTQKQKPTVLSEKHHLHILRYKY